MYFSKKYVFSSRWALPPMRVFPLFCVFERYGLRVVHLGNDGFRVFLFEIDDFRVFLLENNGFKVFLFENGLAH